MRGVAVSHFLDAEEALTGMFVESAAGVGRVFIGGGDPVQNAATELRFYTAANSTTLSGTARGAVKSTGAWVIGDTPEPFTGNALNVAGSGGRVLLYDVATDATTKEGVLGVPHFTNAEEPVCLVFGQALTSGDQAVFIGGGVASHNAVRQIFFFTGPNSTTITGLPRGLINATGAWMIGEAFEAFFGNSLNISLNGARVLLYDSRTDAADKTYKMMGLPFTNAEGPYVVSGGFSTATQNGARIGGGFAGIDACTLIEFYTAAALDTAVGTLAASIDAAGELTLANAIAAIQGASRVESGAGVPASTPADGSFYLRTDGAAGTALFYRTGGAWVAIA